jgi:hypothetical protein
MWGANRDAHGGWPTARGPADLRKQVHENMEALQVEDLDLVNFPERPAHPRYVEDGAPTPERWRAPGSPCPLRTWQHWTT